MTHVRDRVTKDERLLGAASRLYGNDYNTSFLSKSAEEVLYGGIPVSVASEIFHVHDEELKQLIEKNALQPIGRYGKADLYAIYDLATLVVPPTWTEVEWEQVMSRRHFPAQLVKEFWGAKKARQDYLISAGEMWHTDEVTGLISEVFKTVTMGIRLITDNIERETTLTAKQRSLLNEYVDTTLNNAAKHIENTFSERVMRERVQRFEDLTGEIVLDHGTDENAQTEGIGKTQRDKSEVETESSPRSIADL